MQHRSQRIGVALLATGCLGLSACASSGNASTATGAGFSGTTVAIGVDAPLTGSRASLGKGIANSVDLAVKVANRTHEVPGITFRVETRDDQAQPALGAANAKTFVADPTVLGVVGPLNSGVAQSMQKTFADAHLTEVSPSNTNPALSQGPNWASGLKERPYHTYFRTSTTDAVQGPFAAQFAADTLGKSEVFLVNDETLYGSGLVATFQSQFLHHGGAVVGQRQIVSGTKSFAELVAEVKASHADFVYFGGEFPDAGPLSAALKQAGVRIPLIGGDGIFDPAYIQLAGQHAEGDFATSVGAPVAALASAKTYVTDYQAAGYQEPYAAYGGYAYDSAWAVIESVKAIAAMNSGLPSDARQQVEAAMPWVSFTGVTGPVSFDAYGDPINKELTMYTVKHGKWVALKSGTFTG
ncbi:branched-chain amino acid ABC transporter substrate-binding protein [Streptacidiphilus sp. EB103A]|uniref:branched-chain amino acid ABC transporter substrate-binding protein n=1 Tax=Streptacidiphilus sp. EB103A TaxID=3156275 RepID=UPI003519423B